VVVVVAVGMVVVVAVVDGILPGVVNNTDPINK
jgi:hypothetical protein